jgi:hypothetical protein
VSIIPNGSQIRCFYECFEIRACSLGQYVSQEAQSEIGVVGLGPGLALQAGFRKAGVKLLYCVMRVRIGRVEVRSAEIFRESRQPGRVRSQMTEGNIDTISTRQSGRSGKVLVDGIIQMDFIPQMHVGQHRCGFS